jgi:hypothetical protein
MHVPRALGAQRPVNGDEEADRPGLWNERPGKKTRAGRDPDSLVAANAFRYTGAQSWARRERGPHACPRTAAPIDRHDGSPLMLVTEGALRQ